MAENDKVRKAGAGAQGLEGAQGSPDMPAGAQALGVAVSEFTRSLDVLRRAQGFELDPLALDEGARFWWAFRYGVGLERWALYAEANPEAAERIRVGVEASIRAYIGATGLDELMGSRATGKGA